VCVGVCGGGWVGGWVVSHTPAPLLAFRGRPKSNSNYSISVTNTISLPNCTDLCCGSTPHLSTV